MMNMESVGAKLLDFTQPFDVALLDQVVSAMNNPGHPSQRSANQVMVALQEHQDSWTRVCEILEKSKDPSTRFFALQILEDAVRYRWKILPVEQREGIKTYIVTMLLTMSGDANTMRSERVFVNKLNLVLVQVLKHEWPHNWPSFVPDIVSSSKSGELLCQNNMTILKLLSEEIFDFSKDQLTAQKTKELKESLNHEFTQIFQLCEFVLEKSSSASLVTVTLNTLLRFLSWIPFGYIFETNLIPTLLNKFFVLPMFRNDSLLCLTEIVSLPGVARQYESVVYNLYSTFMEHLMTFTPPTTDFNAVFDADEVFVQRLSIFFCGFFRNHLNVVEEPIKTIDDDAHKGLCISMRYLVNISAVDDDGIFKICLEYWHFFTKQLYESQRGSSMDSVLHLGHVSSRKDLFSTILSRVRQVMISKMVKPSEVLIVEDENGEIVRETTKDTEALSQYKTMHETLVYLTHLDYEDTENIMLEKLALQVDGSEWSWNNLNTLCWAIGSISGAMNEEDEKRFLVTVIKDLLGLCEMKRGKDNKAVIASNIMYVVGQYPRFLRAHWKFLKTVVNKLFEFMHELHPGVQDMACDTFLKIAQKCKKKFVAIQTLERQPFIEELLFTLSTIVSDLENHQVHTFYEAVGCMISAENRPEQRDRLISQLMSLPNMAWKNIMAQVSSNILVLYDVQTIKEINKILRTNVSCCKAIGPGFISQIGDMFRDMLNVYKADSERISEIISKEGEIATKMSIVRALRSVKKEVIRLIDVFIETSNDRQVVAQHFIPEILEPVLLDYQRNIPTAREPEVLSLMATCIVRLQDSIASSVPMILEAIFECTLQMITKNFEDFPEHRINFFQLLKAVNDHCFSALFNIPAAHQKLVVDSIVWAFKHTERNIADTGLETLYALLINVQKNPQVAQGFYSSFYLSLLQDILVVLTDRLHKFGYKMHGTILRHLFALVESNQITVPLWEGTGCPPAQSNLIFLRDYVAKMIASSFPNLSHSQVTEFVNGCFDISKDLPAFKTHLRDFLVNIKEFAGEDNSGLYIEEQMAQNRLQQEQAMQAQLAVPGLVNPNEMQDEMDDL